MGTEQPVVVEARCAICTALVAIDAVYPPGSAELDRSQMDCPAETPAGYWRYSNNGHRWGQDDITRGEFEAEAKRRPATPT